mmetsp:Transcript_31367/g.64613  ORF Transcript_31367/g.64613 Transcript_31367/m.64613 type:complete len:281 (+) Transcript_31367:223-1065(+)
MAGDKKSNHGKITPKGKKFQGKQNRKHTSSSSQQQHGGRRKIEITFNPTDRRDYLTGLSSRKKERRAFGLAMQKVKDRQAKLEEKKETREAELEKIEELERNKRALRGQNDDYDDVRDDDDDNSEEGDGSANPLHEHNEKESKTFRDEQTTNHFGGLVSVTTTFGIPSDDEDDESVNSNKEFFARAKHGSGHVDEAQKNAGNVQSYIAKVKGTMNGNKKGKTSGKKGGKKGQHGASSMKGMGNASTVKMAKKTLSKFTAKGAKGGESEKGGRGKKKKGRR